MCPWSLTGNGQPCHQTCASAQAGRHPIPVTPGSPEPKDVRAGTSVGREWQAGWGLSRAAAPCGPPSPQSSCTWSPRVLPPTAEATWALSTPHPATALPLQCWPPEHRLSSQIVEKNSSDTDNMALLDSAGIRNQCPVINHREENMKKNGYSVH